MKEKGRENYYEYHRSPQGILARTSRVIPGGLEIPVGELIHKPEDLVKFMRGGRWPVFPQNNEGTMAQVLPYKESTKKMFEDQSPAEVQLNSLKAATPEQLKDLLDIHPVCEIIDTPPSSKPLIIVGKLNEEDYLNNGRALLKEIFPIPDKSTDILLEELEEKLDRENTKRMYRELGIEIDED